MMKTIKLDKKMIYKGNLILVNEQYPMTWHIQEENLVHVGNHQKMERNAARLLSKIFCHLNAQNKITCVSGYRSNQEQKLLYENSLKENGEEYTKKFVALPSSSEHETGLAIDLGLKAKWIDFICPNFPDDIGISHEFRKLAYDYGFIERYQEHKQTITHIGKEPWHFRYVGYPHSCIMKENDLCLEEYHEFIQKYSIYQPYIYARNNHIIEIFYVAMKEMDSVEMVLKEDAIVQISGNNADGVIITAWRTCL